VPPAKDPGKPADPQPVVAWESVIVRLPITLGQFLKAADLASSGGEAKTRIAAGEVRVNAEVDERRGRKLAPGDLVDRGTGARVAVAVGDGSGQGLEGEVSGGAAPGRVPGRP
jgi:ribosome-associated protein